MRNLRIRSGARKTMPTPNGSANVSSGITSGKSAPGSALLSGTGSSRYSTFTRTGSVTVFPVRLPATALSLAASKSASQNAAGWFRTARYVAEFVTPGRQDRTSHWRVELRSPSCSRFPRSVGLIAATASSSVLETRLAAFESPTTAKRNATFAGISDATRGFSPAHSQRTTLDVYARAADSAADLSTVVLHASTAAGAPTPGAADAGRAAEARSAAQMRPMRPHLRVCRLTSGNPIGIIP